MKRSFGNKSGNLYEGTLTDFHPRTIEKLEIKTNSKTNSRSDITRLTQVLAPEKLQIEELEKHIDVDNFIRFWAVEGLIRFWDGYASNQNNFFLYFDPDRKRGYFIPWGADWTLTYGGPFSFSNSGTTAIYAQSILTNRLYHREGIPNRYRNAMREILDKAWREDELIATIERTNGKTYHAVPPRTST